MSDSILVQLQPSESSSYKGAAGVLKRPEIYTNHDILVVAGATEIYAYTAVGYEIGGNYRYYQYIPAGNSNGVGQAATVSYNIAVRYTSDGAVIYCSYSNATLSGSQTGSHYYTIAYK